MGGNDWQIEWYKQMNFDRLVWVYTVPSYFVFHSVSEFRNINLSQL